AAQRPESISIPAMQSAATPPSPAAPLPAVTIPELQAVPAESLPADYGLMDSLAEARVRLTNAVNQFAESLGRTLTRVIDDASTLQVSTFVIDEMPARLGAEIPADARLSAFTSIKIDGDTQVIVPSGSGGINHELWAIHLDMVEQAQTNRAEMMKAAASAAAGLLQSLKGL
ncbi:MAG TPA: hypothetical protein VN363_08070, partial [Anaerolineales bacterium]|nr:hypothetical protein [Anaerolineales bacterium]